MSPVPPPWYDPARVGEAIDGEALLAAGVHPLGAVRAAVERQPPGGVVTVRTSFEPAPLVDRFRKDGLDVACLREGRSFVTAIRKPP